MTDAEFLASMQAKYPRYVTVGKCTGQVRMYGPAWDAVREQVWTREHGICQDCGKSVILQKGHWQTMHAAHIHGKGAGGDDLPGNIRCLCLECHSVEHSGK